MRQFRLHRNYRGKNITAQVLVLDEGVNISLYGGDKAHIGAVGVVHPDGTCTVSQFAGHREGVICERWTRALAATQWKPAVLEVGIHYDNLDGAGIEKVLKATDKMLDELLQTLKELKKMDERGLSPVTLQKRAVIFDLDGVICSTDKYHYLAWKALADRLGIPFDETINNRLRGVSRMASLEIILEQAKESYTQAQKVAFTEEKNTTYRELLQNMSPADLSDEVRDTLLELRNWGYALAIGSSSRNTKFILSQIGLADFFDAIADGTDITHSKPDPEVFLKAAEKLGLGCRACAVVEDAKSGIQAAKAAHMTALALFGDAKGCGEEDYDLTAFSDLLHILPGTDTN